MGKKTWKKRGEPSLRGHADIYDIWAYVDVEISGNGKRRGEQIYAGKVLVHVPE